MPESTRAVTNKVSVAPISRLLTVQSGKDQTPKLATPETYVNPEGKTSAIETFVALIGPLFVTVIVYTISSPSSGRLLLTVLVKTMSVLLSISIDASNTSPAIVGSVWSPLAAVVMLVTVVPAVPTSTKASIIKLALPPFKISPRVQIPEPLL